MSQLYLIATTSRSGSTHLCRLLASTGRAGRPDEYYNPRRLGEFSFAATKATGDSYFDSVTCRTASANGVCGIKVATDAFALLRAELQARWETLSPKFIWLTRRDVLRQAISLYRAEMTNEWYREQNDAPATQVPVPFDAARILACRRQIEQANEQWRGYFCSNNVRPLKIHYEALAAEPGRVIAEVLQFLEVSCENLPPLVSPLQVMRDDLTDAWAKKIADDNANCTKFAGSGVRR